MSGDPLIGLSTDSTELGASENNLHQSVQGFEGLAHLFGEAAGVFLLLVHPVLQHPLAQPVQRLQQPQLSSPR